MFTLVVQAADWPQWGGTSAKNMVSDERGLPEAFLPGDKDTRSGTIRPGTAKNVRWARKVCDQTFSTPVVAEGKVFLCGVFGHNGGSIACMDEKTGNLHWQWKEDVSAQGFGVCSTPVVEADRLYVISQNCVAMCLDVNGEPDGPTAARRVSCGRSICGRTSRRFPPTPIADRAQSTATCFTGPRPTASTRSAPGPSRRCSTWTNSSRAGQDQDR